MSKYYCKYCGADWSPGGSTLHIDYELKYCLFCGGPDIKGKRKSVVRVPKFETPKQYKERTGREWPMDGPVWIGLKGFHKYFHLENIVWELRSYDSAITTISYLRKQDDRQAVYILCANGPDRPPADWKPEAEK